VPGRGDPVDPCAPGAGDAGWPRRAPLGLGSLRVRRRRGRHSADGLSQIGEAQRSGGRGEDAPVRDYPGPSLPPFLPARSFPCAAGTDPNVGWACLMAAAM